MTDPKPYIDAKRNVEISVHHEENGLTVLEFHDKGNHFREKVAYMPQGGRWEEIIDMPPPPGENQHKGVLVTHHNRTNYGYQPLDGNDASQLQKQIEDAYQGFKSHPSLTSGDAQIIENIVTKAAKKYVLDGAGASH